MKLTTSQKKHLQQLFSNTNDSFFSLLDTYEYEKKQEKLKNAKESYANIAFDEEVLFLLDDTVFGSANEGFVITNQAFYCKEIFNEGDKFLLEDIKTVQKLDDEKFSINSKEIKMHYLDNNIDDFIQILNKLIEFNKKNIINEKNLDLHLNITISQSLARNGGKYKDQTSGYTIPIKENIQDGSVLSWDGYGKSYKDIKGKLTVSVNIEKHKPKPKQTLVQKIEAQPEPKNIVVDCINCGKKNINPTTYNCKYCKKLLTAKEKTELEIQVENDNTVDAGELELIVTCVNCKKDIKNYSSNICPHCNEDANVKKVVQTKSSSEFYLNISDDITVKDIKEQFYKQIGLIIRVYESSRKQARSNKKLINLATQESRIRITTKMKIETIIEKFQDIGIKVRITSFDDSKFCNSDFSLEKAKEKYGE